MQYLPVTALGYVNRLNLFRPIICTCSQVRWKKIPHRKPRWLPMAPSKIFNIPVHPYIPPDEVELVLDLLDEYERKVESLRKVFQEELKEDADNEANILKVQQNEEEEFRLLLEENRKENERIKAIREETLEKEFQEKQLEFLQMAEEKNKEMEETKLKIEEIVRMEKEKSAAYITLENIDASIEQAIDNPVNICFSVTLDGIVKWEGNPPVEYKIDIQRRVLKHS